MITLTQAIGLFFKFLTDRLVSFIARMGINPNVLTVFGLVTNVYAAYLFGYGRFRAAGLAVFCAGAFDILDGQVARRTKNVTPFGAFFDSVMDRYSDLAVYIGLLVYYARANRFFYVVLVALVMAGSVMVSYTRARAESLIGQCRVGFLERPERLVLIIIGGLFNRMAPALWVTAVLSNLTVLHRCIYTWKETNKLQSRPKPS